MRRIRQVFPAAWSSAASGGGDRPERTAGARQALWIALVLVCVVVVVVLTACSGGGSPCSANGGGDGDGQLDGSFGSVSDEDHCPTERGEAPPGMPSTAADGSRGRFITPEPTPALIEWSDWCFFDVAGSGQATDYDCSSVYTTMASALVRVEMNEECVVRESRARIEALAAIGGGDVGAEIAQAVGDYGWHRCPSPVDPDPTDGRSLAEKCASNPELVEWINTWYEGGCAEWAQEKEEFAERALTRPEQSGCFLAQSLLIEWAQAVKGDAPGFLWQC